MKIHYPDPVELTQERIDALVLIQSRAPSQLTTAEAEALFAWNKARLDELKAKRAKPDPNATEEEKRQARSEYMKLWRESNRQAYNEYQRKYRWRYRNGRKPEEPAE